MEAIDKVSTVKAPNDVGESGPHEAGTTAIQAPQKNALLLYKLESVLSNSSLYHQQQQHLKPLQQNGHNGMASYGLIEPLGHLSKLYNEHEDYSDDAEDDRFGLYRKLHQERIGKYKKIATAFTGVYEQCKVLSDKLKKVQSCYDEMNKKVSTSRTQASRLLQESQRLKSLQEDLETKITLTKIFLEKFTLSQEDRNVLVSDEQDLTVAFFDALKRLTDIQHDTKLLMLAEKNEFTTSITQYLDEIQEKAFDRLYKYAQENVKLSLKYSDSSDNIVTPLLRKTMHALRSRHVLLQGIVDEIISLRRSVVSKMFQEAMSLSSGSFSPSATSPTRSNDSLFNDAIRYTGDMLAWVHQSACNEREMLEQLLYDEDQLLKRRSSTRHQNQDNADNSQTGLTLMSPTSTYEDTEELVERILDRVFEGICRPLRLKTDQILSNLPSLSVAFRVANMIQFYASMLERVVLGKPLQVSHFDFNPSSSAASSKKPQQQQLLSFSSKSAGAQKPQLLLYLDDLTQSAFKLFYEILNLHASELARYQPLPPSSGGGLVMKEVLMAPPDILKQTVSDLKELIDSYDSSLIVPLSPSNQPSGYMVQLNQDRDQGLDTIISTLLDPLMNQTLNQYCEQLKNPLDKSIFSVNCLSYTIDTLFLKSAGHHNAILNSRRQALESQTSFHIDIIVEELYQVLLKESGVLPVIRAINSAKHKSEGVPLSRIENMDDRSLKEILNRKFDPYISGISLELSRLLSSLSAGSDKYTQISQICVGKLVAAYREISDVIMDPKKGGYEFPRSSGLLVRSVEEVETIVGVFMG